MRSFYKIIFISSLLLASLWPLPAQVVASQTSAPRLLQSDDNGILLEFHTDDYQIIDRSLEPVVSRCQEIALPGYVQAGVNGEPRLPQKSALLGVPPDVEITISFAHLTHWHTPEIVYPCPGSRGAALEDDLDIPRYVEQHTAPDSAIYDQDRLYPANPIIFEELGSFRSQRIIRLIFSPFQVNPATGRLTQHRRLQVRLDFHKVGQTRSNEDLIAGLVTEEIGTENVMGMINEPATYEEMLADSLLNYDSARKWRAVSPQYREDVQAAGLSRTNLWSPPDLAYRVATEEAGIHAITYDALVAANFPLEDVEPAGFRLFYEGVEHAIWVTGAEDGHFDAEDEIHFYGAAFRDKYTRTNIYWLTYDPVVAGQRMAERASSAVATATDVPYYFADYIFEENVNYLSAIPQQPGYEHWYGSRLTVAGPGNAANEEISLMLEELPDDLRDINAVLPDATLKAAVVANIDGQHHVQLYINDKEVYDGEWEGRAYHEVEVDFPTNYLQEGRNEIRIKLINDLDDRNFDMIYVDRVALRYPRKFVALPTQLSFASDTYGSWRYSLTGFTEDATLYDVTDHTQVSRLMGEVSEDILTFTDSQPTKRDYLALTPVQHHTPLSITPTTVENLLAPEAGADYIFIAHPDFLDAIKPLVRYREFQGHRVRLVNVQDIYDQFNYGRLSAESIRDFLIYAYEEWPSPAPTYVLLVGDGTYDPIGYLDNSYPTYIPPYLEMVDPTLGETAADHRYVTVAGDDLLADMHIGRFPVQNAAQTTAIVQKTIGYETQEITTPWNQELLFIADNLVGGGGSFYRLSNEVADGYVDPETELVPLVPNTYAKEKVYVGYDCEDASPAIECQQQILDKMNQGALLISYVGHATKQFWAEEQLLNLSALDQLENKNNLTVMLPMACLEGYYHEAEAGVDTLSESIVRMADHGAVASWAPTGFGLATGHDYLERGFMEAVFHKGILEMGPATDYGKFYLVANGPAGKYDDLLDTFLVIGDPALRIRVAGSAPSELPPPDEETDPNIAPFDNKTRVFLPIVLR